MAKRGSISVATCSRAIARPAFSTGSRSTSAIASEYAENAAPLVVGYSYGHFSTKDMLKIGAILSVVTAIILLLLVPLYWPLIGIGR
jgi:di/tricarboxylate transporter